eukprot:2696425-Prymnesium_polylepis.1
MLSRAPIPSHVALDAGAGRRPLGAGSTPAKKWQPRHPCTPYVCPGHLHSDSTPTQTLGHA